MTVAAQGAAPGDVPLVLITGASSGIGLALAEAYLARGWRLALVARRLAPMAEWRAARPSQAQARIHLWPADVRDPAAMADMASQCLAGLGVPDVVIANAGISVGGDLSLAEDLPVLGEVLDTNVTGVARTFQPFIEPMVARGRGTLVGVASVAAARGLPGHAAYCASKAGVVALCETLRGELRPRGVKVVTLAPGYVDTPLTAHNDYPMPFLMTPRAFARGALQAIDQAERFRVIPWPMAVVYAVLRALPRPVFDAIMGAQKHRKKRRRG